MCEKDLWLIVSGGEEAEAGKIGRREESHRNSRSS